MINDLPPVMNMSSPFLFADDLKIAKEINTITDCFNLQIDLAAVEK